MNGNSFIEPNAMRLAVLAADYGTMVADDLLQTPVPSFDELMAKAKELERRVNLAMGSAPPPSGTASEGYNERGYAVLRDGGSLTK